MRVDGGKRAVVVGGLGFIGAHLCRALLAEGWRVTIIERPDDGEKERRGKDILPGARLIFRDALDVQAYEKELREAALVANLVGFRGSDPEDAEQSYLLNCRLPLLLLEALRRQGSKAVILHFGSRLQYGAARQLPVDEEAPCVPLDIYGVHKLTAELYHRLYWKLCGVRPICFRITNVYGGDSWNGEGAQTNIVSKIVQTLGQGGTFEIEGEGDQEKDFIHISDVVAAVLACVHDEKCVGEVFNIGSGTGVRFRDAVRMIKERVGKGVVTANSGKASGDPAFVADIGKIGTFTGWAPRVPFSEGIRMMIDHIESRGGKRR